MTYIEVIEAYEKAFINAGIELTNADIVVIRGSMVLLPDFEDSTVDKDITELIDLYKKD